MSRGDRIRTCDLMLPKHPRYQAAPHPATFLYVYTLYQQKERLSIPSHIEKERKDLLRVSQRDEKSSSPPVLVFIIHVLINFFKPLQWSIYFPVRPFNTKLFNIMIMYYGMTMHSHKSRHRKVISLFIVHMHFGVPRV